jgi:hypothetical protein
MTTPIFKVEKITDAEIEIVHLEEGHRYNFLFAEAEKGRRILSEGTLSRNGGLAKHDAQRFAADARRFAETEARKRGKIH